MPVSKRIDREEPAGPDKASLIEECERRMERALKNGSYIEAISLQEILIGDHLSSLNSIASGTPARQENIGRQLLRIDRSKVLEQKLITDLWIWSGRRTNSVQNLINFSQEDPKSWTQRMRFVKDTAQQGQELLDALRSSGAKLKRKV